MLLGFWFCCSCSSGSPALTAGRRQRGVAYFAHIGGFCSACSRSACSCCAALDGPSAQRCLAVRAADSDDPLARAACRALLFIAGFAVLTSRAVVRTGLDVASLLSIFILVLLAVGIVGALRNPPR